jgi:hypothetical protein
MSEPTPIACTLRASERPAREAEIRALGRDGLIDVTEAPARVVLRFRARAELAGRVEAIAAAESECCAFLDFSVEHDADATVLTISAPDGGAEVVHELAALFAGR